VIAAGAILAVAVDVHSSNVDISTIGWIVFAVGVIGFFLSLIFGSAWFRSIYIDRQKDRGAADYLTEILANRSGASVAPLFTRRPPPRAACSGYARSHHGYDQVPSQRIGAAHALVQHPG
jgi:hypothetical protein